MVNEKYDLKSIESEIKQLFANNFVIKLLSDELYTRLVKH